MEIRSCGELKASQKQELKRIPFTLKRPRGKESTEVWITQKKGKERGISY